MREVTVSLSSAIISRTTNTSRTRFTLDFDHPQRSARVTIDRTNWPRLQIITRSFKNTLSGLSLHWASWIKSIHASCRKSRKSAFSFNCHFVDIFRSILINPLIALALHLAQKNLRSQCGTLTTSNVCLSLREQVKLTVIYFALFDLVVRSSTSYTDT